MTCTKCGLVADFCCGACRVYINSSVDDLFSKITALVKSHWPTALINDDYIELKVDEFKSFISQLSQLDDLSYKESSAINVLPLYSNEKLNFTSFSKIKPLSKWISLLKSEDLAYILKHKRLVTYFQPIIDLRDHSIYGYELLSRGLKKDGTIMPPGQMFDLAGESELNFNLDRQARETAIISAARENIKKKLFINFLPTVIYNPYVCLKTTTDLIDKYNFKTENITFEVVETEEIKDTNHLKNILNFYREKGFCIALDDLGSGYSSLNNIYKLTPDYIKIDLEIIRDIHKSPLKQAIFEALTAMAKTTQIKVLAEGIETKEELDFVTAKGADFVQGYYFARPTEKPLRSLIL